MYLVRLGADEARLHAVHGAVESVRRSDAEVTEDGVHPAMQPMGEGPAPAQLVLADSALAFMDTHRDPRPERGEEMRLIDGKFVGRVARLVDRRVDAVEGSLSTTRVVIRTSLPEPDENG